LTAFTRRRSWIAVSREARRVRAPVRGGAGEPAAGGGDLPAIAGEARCRTLALVMLRVKEGRVVEVVDWSRPELFEAFGPDEFSAVVPSNEDEVNAKEVR